MLVSNGVCYRRVPHRRAHTIQSYTWSCSQTFPLFIAFSVQKWRGGGEKGWERGYIRQSLPQKLLIIAVTDNQNTLCSCRLWGPMYRASQESSYFNHQAKHLFVCPKAWCSQIAGGRTDVAVRHRNQTLYSIACYHLRSAMAQNFRKGEAHMRHIDLSGFYAPTLRV